MGYTKMKKGGNSRKKEFPPLHVLMIISILTREDTPVAMCVCVCVCVCVDKSLTFLHGNCTSILNLYTFLNIGICTMQRTTECCLNRLPYFPKLIVNRNTLSFIKIRRKGSGF